MNTDYARLQMVNQQVRGWNVYDEDVLEMLKALPREHFVPDGYESLAFADMAIPLAHGEHMMTPTIEGRLLQALGLWESLAGKLVRGENIGQAFQFVVSGNAELGLVALAQLANPDQRFGGSAWEPPQALYDPIEQQAVLLNDSPAGRDFMAFMRSAEARALIRTYGYDVPDVQ